MSVRSKSTTRIIWNSRAVLWPCKDCGCEVATVRRGRRFTWGVKDGLWKKAGMKPDEFLCQRCLAARIGRPLELKDYNYMTYVWFPRWRWRRMLRRRKASLM
jgi:hypothetical protein